MSANDDQGRRIWLTNDELTRQIVKETNLEFPMLDGGHLQGTVELDVVIDQTGKIACAQVLSGHPIAAAAAIAAIRHWRFKPFVLRNKRVMIAGHLSIPYDVKGASRRTPAI